MKIAILCENVSLSEQAQMLAKELSCPLFTDTPSALNYQTVLVITGDPSQYHWELQFPNDKLNPVSVNFLDSKHQQRKNFGGGRQQAIAKAVGLKRGYEPALLDGTAGFGKDAFVLASLNCKVTMCERNPVIHHLLADGIRRLNLSGMAPAKFDLLYKNTLEHLKNDDRIYDVIYLDPMYPHRTKSALVKKEMRIIRSLVGDDTDFDKVMAVALSRAKDRVVIKRPKSAAPIGNLAPSHCIESKKTRFDVYLTGNNV